MTIEKNVPLPTHKTNKAKYPLSEMNVGDSVLVMEPASRISAAITMYCKRKNTGIKFKTSIQKEGGVRVWRTA